ncbi:MAG: sugar nucleotide-binding protein [Verrucomicrobiota bacterium]
MKKTILLLGGTGYVGSAFRAYFEKTGIAYRNLTRAELDYTSLPVLTKFLNESRPEFVINCAGYTGKPNVDACEIHKTECLFGNAVLPGIVRTACERAAVPWGQVSSGCIYTGSRPDGHGFAETDPPNFSFRQNNCSFYSGTKALGEEVLADAPNCYVWRLRIPFNEVDSPRNYLTKVLRYDRLLEARNSLSQLDEFVRAAFACWQQRVPFGLYNVTNPGEVTTHEVVDLIKRSGVSQKEFQFFTDETEFMRLAAKTPRSNCVLDTGKLQRAGIQLTEVHAAIEQALRKWKTL